MSEFEIIGKQHNDVKIVTAVKVRESSSEVIYDVKDIVKFINLKMRSFYTLYNGVRAEVRVGVSSLGNKYLISSSDKIKENNIDLLPDF